MSEDQIKQAFQQQNLNIFTNPEDFKNYLFNQNIDNTVLLLMSSGNYGGLDFDSLKELF